MNYPKTIVDKFGGYSFKAQYNERGEFVGNKTVFHNSFKNRRTYNRRTNKLEVPHREQ